MPRARPDAHVRVARRNLCVIVSLDIINRMAIAFNAVQNLTMDIIAPGTTTDINVHGLMWIIMLYLVVYGKMKQKGLGLI